MRLLILTLSLAALLGAECATAKMYRWVDAQGKVHYSDKIPPDQAEQARDELSKKALTTRSVPRAKTAEEVAKERELERLRAEQQRLIAEQQAADRVLLRTFRSEDDLILARNGKLEAIDVVIRITQGNIRRAQSKLQENQHRAATMERSGKKVPEQLLKNIDSGLKSISENYALISLKEKEKETIREVFARDLDRFRELKKLAPRAYVQEEKMRTLPNVVKCSGEDCAAVWARAETFVRTYATTRLQMQGENIIMTAAPAKDDDVGITVSRIRAKDATETTLFMDLYCKDTPLGQAFCAGEQVKGIRTQFRASLEAGTTPQ